MKITKFYQTFREPVTVYPNARLMQNLFLARLIPKLKGGGVHNHWTS